MNNGITLISGNLLIYVIDENSRSARRTDGNPFSFKRFLQGGQQRTSSAHNGAGIANLDLANGLPDFVQDHYHSVDHHSPGSNAGGVSNGPRNRTAAHPHSLADVLLPDFALDAAADHSPRQVFVDGPFYGNGRVDSSSGEMSSRWMNPPSGNDADIAGPNHPVNGLARSRSPSGGNDAQLHLSGGSDFEDSLSERAVAGARARILSNSPSPPPEMRHHLSSHASGGLPDFLSDSAIVGAAALVSTPGRDDDSLQDDRLLLNHITDNEATLTTSIRRVC